tara:strand:+ start:54 stop:983 length:930 start_codon:yes stop_codon:yes gene_type:complete
MRLDPSTQKSLFGHNEIFETLKNLQQKEKLPNKIIFSGVKGIGKCTLAYHLINYVLSSNEKFSYDAKNLNINSENKTFKLIQNKSNPNFNLIDVEEGKKNIDINQIRKLISNLNKSSFNSKPRFVLIDNIELLNVNSVNALLKVIEEPNNNTYFVLINNNKGILPTLKSRCINFKISLSREQGTEVTNKILKKNVYNLFNHEFLEYYSTPGQLLKILEFSDEIKFDIKNLSLEEFLSYAIKNKIYKKDKTILSLIFSFIEIYFRKDVSVKKGKVIDFYKYFLKKIHDTKIYNLDEETLLIEFENRILNG